VPPDSRAANDTGGAVAMNEAVDGNSAMVGETNGALSAAARSSTGATAMTCGELGGGTGSST